VFGPGDVDHFAHLSATFGDNAAPEVLLAVVERSRDEEEPGRRGAGTKRSRDEEEPGRREAGVKRSRGEEKPG